MSEQAEQITPKLSCFSNAIDSFLHVVRDTEEAASKFIPLARRIEKKRLRKVEEDYDEAISLISSDSSQEKVLGGKKLDNLVRKLERMTNSNIPDTLEKSLFLHLFSGFDTYISNIVLCVASYKHEFVNGIGKQFSVSEILEFKNFDEFKSKVINDEIESIRRKSYVEQFEYLEKKIGITLRKFKHWPDFVEITQRRNLVMHCDNTVSEQYLKVCKEQGFNPHSELGSKLELDGKYMKKTCNTLAEVAIKLGQTLWRKINENEHNKADSHLTSIVYDYLHEEDLDKAILLGEYAQDLPNIASDLTKRINVINLAIAYQMSDKHENVSDLLGSLDWTASTTDLKLAHSILLNDYDESKKLMIRLGKNGELINEEAYHKFPLFYKFRKTPQFLDGYQEVYGYSYASELLRQKEEAEAEEELDFVNI